MSDTVKELLTDIQNATNDHDANIRLLEQMTRLARMGHSSEDCGSKVLQMCDGDLAMAREWITFYQKTIGQMLVEWYVGAALSHKEPKETK